MPTTLRARLLLAETAVNACHAAMLGKVHPKSPAWGLVYAVQDAKRAAGEQKREPTDMGNKSHLGDGVYVDFDGSGSIVMTTENGVEVSNTIYLEPEVLRALDEYRKRLNPPPP